MFRMSLNVLGDVGLNLIVAVTCVLKTHHYSFNTSDHHTSHTFDVIFGCLRNCSHVTIIVISVVIKEYVLVGKPSAQNRNRHGQSAGILVHHAAYTFSNPDPHAQSIPETVVAFATCGLYPFVKSTDVVLDNVYLLDHLY